MAEEIVFKIDTDVGGSEKSVGDLRQEFKDLQTTINQTTIGTEEYKKAMLRLGEVKGTLDGVKTSMEALDPQKKAMALTQIGVGIASGFAAAQGAMALFGTQSEDLLKMLVKIQAAMAISQGIQGIMQLGQAFKVVSLVIKSAIASTGIGLFILALSAIGVALVGFLSRATTKVKDFDQAIKDCEGSVKTLNEELKKSGKAADDAADDYAIAIGKMTTTDKARKDESDRFRAEFAVAVRNHNKTIKEIEDAAASEIHENKKWYAFKGTKVATSQKKEEAKITEKYEGQKKEALKAHNGITENIKRGHNAIINTIDAGQKKKDDDDAKTDAAEGKSASDKRNSEDEAAQEKKINLEAETRSKAVEILKNSYDDNITIAKARGKDTYKLEVEAFQKQIKLLQTQIDTTKEFKEGEKEALLRQMEELNLGLLILTIEKNNKILEQDKELARRESDLRLENNIIEAQIGEDDKAIAEAEYQQSLADLQAQADEKGNLTAEQQRAIELLKKRHEANLTKIENDANEERNRRRWAQAAEVLQVATGVANAFTAINDARLAHDLKQAEGDVVKQEKIRKDSFERNKKLQISMAIISGLSAIVNILGQKSTLPIPLDTIFKAIAIAASVVTTVATIAKIKATTYESTTPPPAPDSALPTSTAEVGTFAASAPATQMQTEEGEWTGWGGDVGGSGGKYPHIKAYVVETEISDKQKHIKSIEEKAIF